MIEVKTIFNRDMLVKFNKSQIMKKIWISFIAAAALVGIGIACLFDDDLGLPFSIPVMVIGVFMPVFYVWWTRYISDRIAKNSLLIKNETVQIFRFSQDMIMTNESSRYVIAKDTRISYEAIMKVVEKEDAFYLFVDKTQAYIIDAKGFTAGSRKELHDFLIDKLGAGRYKFSNRLYAAK